MTLIVVGNVDSACDYKQIDKFGDLKGKRETPAPVPHLSAASGSGQYHDQCRTSGSSVHHVGYAWQPIRESAALLRYWRAISRVKRCSGTFSRRSAQYRGIGLALTAACCTARAVRYQPGIAGRQAGCQSGPGGE
ncbi:hypothetical protein ACNKHO_22310 [Shigella flexneri]